MDTNQFKTAFDLAADCSWQNNWAGFKLKNGRQIYTDATFNSRRDGDKTYIWYLKPTDNLKIRVIGRYVKNTTPIELIN